MIEVLYKNKDFVVIYKPQGVPSQSDASGSDDAMSAASRALEELGEDSTLWLIHRLDRVVGGLIVFARNKKSAAILSSIVAEHNITKEYFAVVEGRAERGIMHDYIYKDATLSKAFVTDRKRSGVKEAELEYTTVDTISIDNREISLVRVRLKTGRFHQIRAQFSSRKMPLIGDKKYGSRDFKAKTPSLFATRLEFSFNGNDVSECKLPDLTVYPWSLFEEEKYVL